MITMIHSNIYPELHHRAWEKKYGRLISVAILTFVVLAPVACLVFNYFYPVNTMHALHQYEAWETAISIK
jgi:hypothetical protein